MVKKPLLTALLLLFSSIFLVQDIFAQSDTWVVEGGGSNRDYVSDVYVDAQGNAYITGYFQDNFEIGGQTLVARGSNDVFVAKYDADGNFQWVQQHGWFEDDFAYAITEDEQGHILVVGGYQDSTIIDGDTILSLDTLWFGPYAKTFDPFTIEHDPATGQVVDWFSNGWFASEHVYDIAINDAAQRIFAVTWNVNSQWQTGFPGIQAKGFSDAMLVALDSGAHKDDIFHTLQFSMRSDAGGKQFDSGKEVEIIGDSLYALGGTFQDTIYFDKTNTLAITDFEDDVYIVVRDDTTGFRWAMAGGSDGKDDLSGMTTDPNGNIYISGLFEGTFEMGGMSTAGVQELDGFVGRLSHNGQMAWLKSFGGKGFDGVTDIKYGSSGDLIVTGYFQGEMVAGSTTLMASDSLDQDMFVLSLDLADGTVRWAWSGGGTGVDAAQSVELQNDYIYVLGTFSGTANIGQQQIVSNGSDDMVLFRMTRSGAVSRPDAQVEAAQELHVYPNPNKGAFSIGFVLNESSEVALRVFDAQGRAVYAQSARRFAPGHHTLGLKLEGVPTGLYFLEVQTEVGRSIRKLQILN